MRLDCQGLHLLCQVNTDDLQSINIGSSQLTTAIVTIAIVTTATVTIVG